MKVEAVSEVLSLQQSKLLRTLETFSCFSPQKYNQILHVFTEYINTEVITFANGKSVLLE